VNAPFVSQKVWLVPKMGIYFGVGVMPRMFRMVLVKDMHVRAKGSATIAVTIADQLWIISFEKR
jgi:hypothetical protein